MIPEPEFKGDIEKGKPLLVAVNPLIPVIIGLEEPFQVDCAAYRGKGFLLFSEKKFFGKLLLYVLVGQFCRTSKPVGLQLGQDVVNLVLAPRAGIGRGCKSIHQIEGIDILIDLVVQCYNPLPVAGLCTAGKDAEG